VGASRYTMATIPHYYELAPKVGIAPDVLVTQAMPETGNGYYGGDSGPWNMPGIKKGGATGSMPLRASSARRPPVRAPGCTQTTWPPTPKRAHGHTS
jgi:hypothetical protein